MMRFQQLMRKSNAILKKKMYKSGKNWIVKSTLGLVGGLALFGVTQNTVVKADPVNDSGQLTGTQEAKQVSSDASNGAIQPDSVNTQASPVPNTSGEKETPNLAATTMEPQGEEVTPVNLVQKSNPTPAPIDEQTSGTVAGVNWNLDSDEDTGSNTDLHISSGSLDEISPDSDPWGTAGDYLRNTVTSITIGGNTSDSKVIAKSSITNLFKGFKNVTDITGLNNLDVSNTDNLSGLFSGCNNLKTLDFSGMNMKETANVTDMLKGDQDINVLTLSPNINLTDSGLSLSGPRNEQDESKGAMGWHALYRDDGSKPEVYLKKTTDLIALYNGNSQYKDIMIWQNNAIYTINVIGQDTNGGKLGMATINIPVGYSLSKEETTYMNQVKKEFNDEMVKLKSNGSVILNNSVSGMGSRLEKYSSDGIKDNQFIPLNQEYLDKNNSKDFYENIVDGVNKYFFTADEIKSGEKENFYLVYPAKKQINTGSGSSSSGNSSTINRDIEGIEETIATYAEKPDVQLYDDDGSIITDRKLAPNSDWFTDESMQLNKDKFYRVATNQWAKAEDVYLYYPNESKVRVNSGSIARLVTDEGKAVTDRALQPLSNWYTDKYIYINDVKYYRVATNEFVSANDVTEY